MANVTVVNDGEFTETFNITAYANATAIWTQTVSNLLMGASETLTFNWTSKGLAYGNYTVSAYISPVPNEIYTENNELNMSGFLTITIPGDINGDGKVGLTDLVFLANAYGTTPATGGTPGVAHAWNPNVDIDNNGIVGLSDLVILALHYGQHYP